MLATAGSLAEVGFFTAMQTTWFRSTPSDSRAQVCGFAFLLSL
jgi:hypothetical protein